MYKLYLREHNRKKHIFIRWKKYPAPGVIIMKYLFILLLVFVLSDACIAQNRPLLHLATGETYYLNSTGISQVMQSVNGREEKVNLTLSYRMAFKVTGVKDSIYAMQVSYQSLQMKIRMADTTMDMGADQKSKLDTPSAIIAQMMNKPFGVRLSNTGRVRSIDNLDQVIGTAFDIFPQLGGSKKEEIKSRFIQSFGQNAFKGNIEMGIAILPAAAVSKNYKWVANTSQQMPAPVNVRAFYQLVDITAAVYQVHGEGSLATDSTTKPMDVDGMPLKYDLQGTTLTDVKIDRKTGWIIELQLRQLMEGNMIILDNPKIPGGKSIPMLFTTELTAIGGKNP